MKALQEMTREEFRTIMETVRMIVDGSRDKEDALKKTDSLTILKKSEKEKMNKMKMTVKETACHRLFIDIRYDCGCVMGMGT